MYKRQIIGILYNSDLSSERKGVYRISALNLAKSIADAPTYFNKLKNPELLFIDDVGTEPASVKSWGNEFSPVTELIYAQMCIRDRDTTKIIETIHAPSLFFAQ